MAVEPLCPSPGSVGIFGPEGYVLPAPMQPPCPQPRGVGDARTRERHGPADADKRSRDNIRQPGHSKNVPPSLFLPVCFSNPYSGGGVSGFRATQPA